MHFWTVSETDSKHEEGGWDIFSLNLGRGRRRRGQWDALHSLSHVCSTAHCLWGDTGTGLTFQTCAALCVLESEEHSFFNCYEPARLSLSLGDITHSIRWFLPQSKCFMSNDIVKGWFKLNSTMRDIERWAFPIQFSFDDTHFSWITTRCVLSVFMLFNWCLNAVEFHSKNVHLGDRWIGELPVGVNVNGCFVSCGPGMSWHLI